MSFKHIIPSKVHKERHQLPERNFLGFLEKKKDYKKRSKEYHDQKNNIKKLTNECFFRNKDEFHYSMIHSKTENGKIILQKNDEILLNKKKK
eukprot:GHVL01007862.1.p1 GENE.GHVL01007862.1~~GHVL01007862.1.p1  ORF type:complete len:106 (+),score=33.25 GHVL01007862.1:45-320(+)